MHMAEPSLHGSTGGSKKIESKSRFLRENRIEIESKPHNANRNITSFEVIGDFRSLKNGGIPFPVDGSIAEQNGGV
jgi:hypothetical protein